MSSPDKTRAGISLREEGARKTDRHKTGACKTDGRVATHADELHKTAGARKTGNRDGLYGPSRTGRTRRLAFAAMFAALALIFSYVEVLVPIPVPIPGVKLGLANLVILIALYRLGFRYAFAINCVRIVLAGLLFSGVFGMLYSFGGGILSILIMYLLYRTKLFSMVGISMAGGVMHNLGQLLTACAIMSNLSLMSYFAVLFFSGLISGILIGILAYSIEKRLPADFR